MTDSTSAESLLSTEPPVLPKKFRFPEGTTDMQMAMFLKKHIDTPCGVTLEDGQAVNIRDFYLNEARRILTTMTNPFAKELLTAEIEKYEKEKNQPPTSTLK